jgi:uncharacterized protein YidB (DUF937 family)
MSMITDIQQKAASVLGSSNTQVTQAISQIIDECGGMDGLMRKFSDKGLGDVVQSWVSNTANKPITSDQVKNVLGLSLLEKVATRVGMTPDSLSQQVATYLPLLVDKLSPHGSVPHGGWWSRSVEKAKEFFGMKH